MRAGCRMRHSPWMNRKEIVERQVLASYGFDAGAWRMDGWGISLDGAHANFVPEPRMPQCHYVLGVPLDCDELQIASR